MKTVSGILKRLGGVGAVASGLECSYQTVHSWIGRGFPASRCVEIRDFAKRCGVRLTVEQILAARPDAPSASNSRGNAAATA